MTTSDVKREIGPRFPWWCVVGLVLTFCLCVALKLNGSSVGMWSDLLQEHGSPRGLLFSSPKLSRIDEWGVWTPAMLSQAQQTPPFPIENKSLGAGRAPLIMSVPVAYYTTLFRPQLWGFFLFDFEHGFSFYWCAKAFGLLLAVGWALRQIGLRSRLLVIFGAVWVVFSSWVQWWFSSPAMFPEMIATWAICLGCAVEFLKRTPRWKIVAALVGFIFCGTNFVLCLYPPGQIPLILLMLAILTGIWLERRYEIDQPSAMRALLLLAAASTVIVLILIRFWIDVRPTLEIVAHTVYPGTRRSSGGGLTLFKLFSGVLGFFEAEQVGPAVYENISEASNFYPLWPAAALAVLGACFRTKKPISPLIAALSVFLICSSIYCLVRPPRWLLHVTLLEFVTDRRVILALGIANIIFCCLFLDRYRFAIFSKRGAAIAGFSVWFAIVILLWRARIENFVYFSDPWHWIYPLTISAVILCFFFWERLRYRFLPAVLGLLLIFSNAGINPLMRGLSPLLDSAAFKSIDRLRKIDPDGKWMVFNNRYFAQLVKATGAPIFNGTKIVPDLPFLHQLDPGTNDFTYNRYANIVCELPRNELPVDGGLVSPDFYILFLPPNLPPFLNAGYRYVLFPNEWKAAATYGFSLVERISPGDLWIYHWNSPAKLALK